MFDTTFNQISDNRRDLAEMLHLDVPLLVGILSLSVISLFVLYSASGQTVEIVWKQTLHFAVAFVVMLGLAQVPPDVFRRWTPWLFAAGVLLLFAVMLFGHVGKGAQRWLDLGVFQFQPSEIMKLVVPMMVAWYLGEQSLPPDKRRLFNSTLIIVIPVILIVKQPDLGTGILVSSAGLFVLFLAGMYWRVIFFVIGLGAAFAPAAWYFMRDYQRQRVLTLLNPEMDPLGTGYHIIQSKIAIGSGGLYGKGWLNGTQSQLKFLPERSTDFIFAAYAEEFGFLGVLLLLVIYLFVLSRGLLIAAQAQDTFTRLLSGALILTFFLYVFVNIGMVIGLLPVVGVPLPLISYGGTSIVTLMAGFGMLMSIHTHRKLLPK